MHVALGLSSLAVVVPLLVLIVLVVLVVLLVLLLVVVVVAVVAVIIIPCPALSVPVCAIAVVYDFCSTGLKRMWRGSALAVFVDVSANVSFVLCALQKLQMFEDD